MMRFHSDLTCDVCGAAPCINPGFCSACRRADRRRAQASAQVVDLDGVRRDHGVPQATIEALMHSLRERGLTALEEQATKRRLSELSEEQLIEVGNRLQRLKVARAWTAEEVKQLLRTSDVSFRLSRHARTA
jgi:transposase